MGAFLEPNIGHSPKEGFVIKTANDILGLRLLIGIRGNKADINQVKEENQ